jgi:hypothetical protein
LNSPRITSQDTQQTQTIRDLNSIQKARRLASGKSQGQSNRGLAKSFDVSESTVRALLSLLLLPVADQAAIESGAPYRPYLAQVAHIKAEKRNADAGRLSRLREQAAQKGLRVIRDVFKQCHLTPPFTEQILYDVRGFIRGGELEGILKPSAINWVNDVDAILAATKPPNLETLTFTDFDNGIIAWLCRALVRLIPNSDVRERAIDLALEGPAVIRR